MWVCFLCMNLSQFSILFAKFNTHRIFWVIFCHYNKIRLEIIDSIWYGDETWLSSWWSDLLILMRFATSNQNHLTLAVYLVLNRLFDNLKNFFHIKKIVLFLLRWREDLFDEIWHMKKLGVESFCRLWYILRIFKHFILFLRNILFKLV